MSRRPTKQCSDHRETVKKRTTTVQRAKQSKRQLKNWRRSRQQTIKLQLEASTDGTSRHQILLQFEQQIGKSPPYTNSFSFSCHIHHLSSYEVLCPLRTPIALAFTLFYLFSPSTPPTASFSFPSSSTTLYIVLSYFSRHPQSPYGAQYLRR